MKKINVKIPAKLNLTLDITGENGGYHTLDSLFVGINVYDYISVKKRKDGKIRLSFSGVPVSVPPEKSNAYRAAESFAKKFGTGGADISVRRKILSGGGMGGSSADAAGVIKGLAALYGVSDQAAIKSVADAAGSDVAFMLRGGFARVKERGTDVAALPLPVKLYFLIVAGEKGVDTAQCFARYDKKGITYPPCTERALGKLLKGDVKGYAAVAKNDLYPSACELCRGIDESVAALGEFAPSFMTGSGSAVFAVFGSARERNAAYAALKGVYGKRLIKAETENARER